MENKIVFLEEMETAVRGPLAKVPTSDGRRLMTDRLFDFVNFLDNVQRMPMVVRLQYYRAAFAVYNLLRRNKQLGRREGGFSTEVRCGIVHVLYKIRNKNYFDNGTDKD